MKSMFNCFVHFIWCPRLLLLFSILNCEPFSCTILHHSAATVYVLLHLPIRLSKKSSVQIDSRKGFDSFFMSLQKCILLVQRQVYSSGIIIIIIIIILVIIEWSHVNFYQRICFNFEGWCQQGTSQVKNFSENSVFMSQDSLHESIQVPLTTLKRFGIDLLLNFTMVVT